MITLTNEQRQIIDYCRPHLDSMWAAVVVSIILHCSFRDAEQELKKHDLEEQMVRRKTKAKPERTFSPVSPALDPQTPDEVAESAEVKRQETFNGLCSVLTPLNGNERQRVLKLVCMHFNISVATSDY